MSQRDRIAALLREAEGVGLFKPVALTDFLIARGVTLKDPEAPITTEVSEAAQRYLTATLAVSSASGAAVSVYYSLASWNERMAAEIALRRALASAPLPDTEGPPEQQIRNLEAAAAAGERHCAYVQLTPHFAAQIARWLRTTAPLGERNDARHRPAAWIDGYPEPPKGLGQTGPAPQPPGANNVRGLLERVVQRLESHGESCCHLDARDRSAVRDANAYLGARPSPLEPDVPISSEPLDRPTLERLKRIQGRAGSPEAGTPGTTPAVAWPKFSDPYPRYP